MLKQTARRKSRLLRNAYGSTAAEAFMIVTILIILITRLQPGDQRISPGWRR